MTRKEIVKALRCYGSIENCPVEECNEKCPYWLENDKFDLGGSNAEISDRYQLCRAAADMLEQDARGWISVKDKMPNVDEKVIVFAIGKYDGFIGDTVYAMSMILDRPSGKRWAVPWQYFDVDYEITHWMPLPEPPEEGMEC